ncbi:hypothetical protein PMIN05_012604 [Paraphaeosphaeria minitans]
MLHNIDGHAVVGQADLGRPRALQLQRALTVLVDLGLFNLTHLVLVTPPKHIPNHLPPNPYRCVLVVERV